MCDVVYFFVHDKVCIGLVYLTEVAAHGVMFNLPGLVTRVLNSTFNSVAHQSFVSDRWVMLILVGLMAHDKLIVLNYH